MVDIPTLSLQKICGIVALAYIPFQMLQTRKKKLQNKLTESTTPYPVFQHPNRSFLDTMLFGLACNAFVRLHEFQTCSLDITSAKTKKLFSRYRNACSSLSLGISIELSLWNRSRRRSRSENSSSKDTIIQRLHCALPRKAFILSEWNIAQDNNPIVLKSNRNLQDKKEFVDISICAPMDKVHTSDKYCKDDIKNRLTLPDFQEQMKLLSSSDHILLYFWGGGMSVKVETPNGITISRTLLDLQMKHIKKSKKKEFQDSLQNAPNIILITTNYRLAPEHPFPASIIDSFSVLDFLVEHLPKHVPIHLCGESAGANIAANLVLEAHKRFPGRIQSACLIDPMLSPKCTSNSFYMNSNSGLANWGMWSWRCYLSLDNKDHERYSLRNNGIYRSYDTYEDFILHGSNQRAIERSNLMHNELWKIIEPISNIKQTLNFENMPKIVLTTAAADPLQDEGIEFANALKATGANVTLLESKSSHTMGILFDKHFKKKLFNEMRKSMFQKESKEHESQ